MGICRFQAAVWLFLLSPFVLIAQAPIGILGGFDGNTAYAAFIDITTGAAGPNLSNLPSASGNVIYGVSINNFGQAIVGGKGILSDYAAFVNLNTNSANSLISNLPVGDLDAGPPFSVANAFNVAINDVNQVLVGGFDTFVPFIKTPYAAFVDINTNAAGAPISTPLIPNTNTKINSVAITNSEQFLIVGANMNVPYAAYVDPATNAAGATVANLPGPGDQIYACAMNQSGQTLIAGYFGGYAAFVDPNTNTASSNFLTPAMNIDRIIGAALNDSGQGLLGGNTNTNIAYASFVDSATSTVSAPIANLPTAAGSFIYSVALNDFGQGLVGGTNGTSAYAAFVDPITNSASDPIPNLPTTPGSVIRSVALIVSPKIPTGGLSDNNLIFANYINANAQRAAFYFLPASMNGTLANALESAAPTRNAFSLFAADQNVLFLNRNLSLHLQNRRHFQTRLKKPLTPPVALATLPLLADLEVLPALDEGVSSDSSSEEPSLQSSSSEERVAPDELPPPETPHPLFLPKNRENGLWFEAIGATASQNAQSQTPGFNPWTGGCILAWDKRTTENSLAGVGTAYTFTHVSEHQDRGSSDIHQEYLFGYATWMKEPFYFDGVLWLSFFQTDQVRQIDFSGFHFQSTSSPHGWQLSPHAEFGYEHSWFKNDWTFLLDPFAMVDWVNAWQGSYQETGPSPFNAGQESHYSSLLRTEIGLRAYQTLSFKTWRCTFEEKGSYVNATPFMVGRVTAFLVGSPGSFTVETLSSSQNLGALELSAIFEPIDPSYPYGSLSYQGEFSPSYQSHQFSAEVSWDF